MDFYTFYVAGNRNECPLQLSYLLLFSVSFSNVCMRPELITLTMSCDSVCCMWCDLEQSLMTTLLTNGQHACVYATDGHSEQIL